VAGGGVGRRWQEEVPGGAVRRPSGLLRLQELAHHPIHLTSRVGDKVRLQV